jgi:hypothetical protein
MPAAQINDWKEGTYEKVFIAVHSRYNRRDLLAHVCSGSGP